jgi:hypothetical protein
MKDLHAIRRKMMIFLQNLRKRRRRKKSAQFLFQDTYNINEAETQEDSLKVQESSQRGCLNALLLEAFKLMGGKVKCSGI